MVKEGKRTRNLESASNKVTIFAILALLASVASGFQLYKLIMDALDLSMEGYFKFLKPIEMFGLKINEAQLSLALGFLMFLVPFWILISLLVKRHGLKNGEIVGTGLFWLIFLVSIFGILHFLGILPKLLALDFSNLTDIKFDLMPMLGAAASLIAAILSLWTIINISAADRAPAEYLDDEEYEEDIIDEDVVETKSTRSNRRERRVSKDEDIEESIEKTSVALDNEEEFEEVAVKKSPEAYGYDDKPITTKKEEIIVKPTSNENFNAVNLDDTTEMAPIKTNSFNEEAKVVAPVVTEKVMENVKPMDLDDDMNIKEVASSKVEEVKNEFNEHVAEPVKEFNEDVAQKAHEVKEEVKEKAYDIKEEVTEKVEDVKEDLGKGNIFENPSNVREEEIKIMRKYIEMPGEDKVIVVTREFSASGKLLHESTEVKNKNEIR